MIKSTHLPFLDVLVLKSGDSVGTDIFLGGSIYLCESQVIVTYAYPIQTLVYRICY